MTLARGRREIIDGFGSRRTMGHLELPCRGTTILFRKVTFSLRRAALAAKNEPSYC